MKDRASADRKSRCERVDLLLFVERRCVRDGRSPGARSCWEAALASDDEDLVRSFGEGRYAFADSLREGMTRDAEDIAIDH